MKPAIVPSAAQASVLGRGRRRTMPAPGEIECQHGSDFHVLRSPTKYFTLTAAALSLVQIRTFDPTALLPRGARIEQRRRPIHIADVEPDRRRHMAGVLGTPRRAVNRLTRHPLFSSAFM
jgi:hypothetical protein